MELFSSEWMEKFKEAWNADESLKEELAKIGFTSVIAYGVKGEDNPRGVLVVKNGEAVEGAAYGDQDLNWDLRADEATWEKWLVKPPGMMGLGAAYTSGKLKFVVGDYGAMVKDPRMATPFINSFQVMARV